MITLLTVALVSRVKSVPLSSNYQIFFMHNLVRIVAAGSSGDSNEQVVNIKDEVVLAH